MVNVTVNTRTLNTHIEIETETKPNHSASRRRVQLRGGWSTELKLKAEPEAELDTRPNSWLPTVKRQREGERSTAGKESKRAGRWESTYLLCLCLPTFSAQCCCSCYLNEAVLPYASTHCSAGTHTHALHLNSGSITCAACAQWSNKLTTATRGH